eukprot:TRINITY_DN2228_c1_g1_i1.p1 TRINITY_DN2228_c1_g1~~TRINITY_DN2228_c1_g1_i1.p1  ORF type:complete len:828 (+),score=101.92 TRINITY_DN2228_c1_g1_i1:45-2528(+)
MTSVPQRRSLGLGERASPPLGSPVYGRRSPAGSPTSSGNPYYRPTSARRSVNAEAVRYPSIGSQSSMGRVSHTGHSTSGASFASPKSSPRYSVPSRPTTPGSHSLPQSPNQRGILHQGWLQKHPRTSPTSIFSSKKPYYFCLSNLNNPTLTYFEDGEAMQEVRKSYSVVNATVTFENRSKGIIKLVLQGGKKTVILSASDGAIDGWVEAIEKCKNGRKSSLIRSQSIRNHCGGFDKLLASYRTITSSAVDSGNIDAADVNGLANCVQNLADPSQLALSKLKDLPSASHFLAETLASIWDAFDADKDGYLNPRETEALVDSYFRSIQKHAPVQVEDSARRIFRLFCDKDLPKNYLTTVIAKAEKELEVFFTELHKDIPNIAREMWCKMDRNGDGMVSREEFMQTFLECSEISYLSTAIQGTVGDEIARQMRVLIDRHLKRPLGTCGLKNLGNTCYMNSAIQCLSATVRFRQFFINETYKNFINPENQYGTKGKLAEAFAELMKNMWTGKDDYSPTTFKKVLGRANDQFAGWGQEDSQELVSFLLDRLHEDLNKVSKKTYIELKDPPGATDAQLANMWWSHHIKQNLGVVVSLFHGQIRSVVTCLSCRRVSKAFDPIMYLSLPVPASGKTDLTSCLDKYMGHEEVRAKDEWYCSHCKTHRPFRKDVSVWKLPAHLIIHLKRFKYSMYGTITSKIETEVSIPHTFSPEPWLSRSLSETISETPADEMLSEATSMPYLSPRTPTLTSPVTSPLHRRTGREFGDSSPPKVEGKYHLYAITNHYGSTGGGHYTANARVHNQWHVFDDSYVTQMKEDPAKKGVRSGYVLYYELK